MTTTEIVRSETILREIRARVLTLVKNPPKHDDPEACRAWKAQVDGLASLEVIYSRPEIIPLGAPAEQRYQVRP